ncbi:unnamed protein product, partial [Ectocarpus sp. 4 AP-2014]
KEFPFGLLEGKVAFCHRPDGDALLVRVEYTDGDSEDLPEEEVRDLLLPPSYSSPTTARTSSSSSSSQPAAAAAAGAGSGTVIVTPPN